MGGERPDSARLGWRVDDRTGSAGRALLPTTFSCDGFHRSCDASRASEDGFVAMSASAVILVVVAVAAVLSGLLLVWNSRQREQNAPPPRQHRDLDDRVDHVVAGTRDVTDRAVRLAGQDAASLATGWSAVRTDMLAIEGDIVNLDVHVGEAPLGHSLADLDRAVHALRDTVEHHAELRAAEPADERAIALSHEAIGERRRDVERALTEVESSRP